MRRRVPRSSRGVFGATGNSVRPAVRVAVLVTLLAIPFIAFDLFGAGSRDDADDEVAVQGTQAERSTSSTAAGPTSTAPAPSIPIDQRWLPMGSSTLRESDDDTSDRIQRRRGLIAAAQPTTTTTSTTLPGSSTTRPVPSTSARAGTVPPSVAGPPPTPAPPPTDPPASVPPPTEAPPPPPTEPPPSVPGP